MPVYDSSSFMNLFTYMHDAVAAMQPFCTDPSGHKPKPPNFYIPIMRLKQMFICMSKKHLFLKP